MQAEIDTNRSAAFTQALPAVRSAWVFGLAMAMPTQLQTPDVILQLDPLAQASGLSFDQIQPGASGRHTGTTDPFAAEPIQVKFSGSYYGLLTFLQRLRNLVRVQNGKLYTAGRLFDVSEVNFRKGQGVAPDRGDTHDQRVRATAGPARDCHDAGQHRHHVDDRRRPPRRQLGTSAAPSTSGGTS